MTMEGVKMMPLDPEATGISEVAPYTCMMLTATYSTYVSRAHAVSTLNITGFQKLGGELRSQTIRNTILPLVVLKTDAKWVRNTASKC